MIYVILGLILRSWLIFILIFASATSAGEIYRWVDEKGQVNFSTTPPPKVAHDAEAVNLGFNKDLASSTSGTGVADSALNSVLGADNDWQDKCKSAVESAQREFDVGQDTVKKNQSGGYITVAAMKQQLGALTAALRSISVQDCVTASEKRKKQYQCLAEFKGMHNCGFGKIV